MVTVKLFVEGGGDSRIQHDICRKGFRLFLEKAGFSGRMPRILACGSRNNAYSDYITAINNGENAVLLIDSEGPIHPNSIIDSTKLESWNPWLHLQCSDKWSKPEISDIKDCHLMVEIMEAWFIADIDTLKEYFGYKFNEGVISFWDNVEEISKSHVMSILVNATKASTKGIYRKGKHSFEILARINSRAVVKKSIWARRFIELLSKKLQS